MADRKSTRRFAKFLDGSASAFDRLSDCSRAFDGVVAGKGVLGEGATHAGWEHRRFVGFGAFAVQNKAMRVARNPRLGELKLTNINHKVRRASKKAVK